MTKREANKLGVGDQFKRPSTNGHDNGWRIYSILTSLPDGGFQTEDQHGYRANHNPSVDMSFLKQCEVMK